MQICAACYEFSLFRPIQMDKATCLAVLHLVLRLNESAMLSPERQGDRAIMAINYASAVELVAMHTAIH